MRGQLIAAGRVRPGDIVRPASCKNARIDGPIWVHVTGHLESGLTTLLYGYLVWVGEPRPSGLALMTGKSEVISKDKPYRILIRGCQ